MTGVIEARWDGAARAWIVRAPWGGWTQVPGVWREDEAAAAALRLYGKQAINGLRVVVVDRDRE